MSVVVYKDGVLACDLQATIGDLLQPTQVLKIAKINGHLFGGVGDPFQFEDLLRWVRQRNVTDMEPVATDSRPDFITKDEADGDKSSDFLWITPDGEIRLTDHNQFPAYFSAKHGSVVLGSGREVAAGALHMNASPVEAAVAACALNAYCGVGVATLKLGGDPNAEPEVTLFRPLELMD